MPSATAAARPVIQSRIDNPPPRSRNNTYAGGATSRAIAARVWRRTYPIIKAAERLKIQRSR
jgi:hypothetical protein